MKTAKELFRYIVPLMCVIGAVLMAFNGIENWGLLLLIALLLLTHQFM